MRSTDLLARLEAGALPPEDFDHRAHITAAWEALRQDDFFSASARMARSIRALAEAAGAPEKFNATITHAFMSLIAERHAEAEADTIDGFLDQNPDLLSSSILNGLYTKDRMTSALARRIVLMPDVPMSCTDPD